MIKIKKNLGVLVLLLCLVMSLFVFGCTKEHDCNPVSIQKIEKTGSVGLVDFYTIFYSDGTSSTFEITNGANGTNGNDAKDVTAYDLYDAYKEIYGQELSYDQFLKLYLKTDEVNTANVINDCLLSVAKVYSEFKEYNQNTNDPFDVKNALYTGACIIYKMEEEYTYFMTNYHVVYDAKAVESEDKIANKIYCYLYGSEDAPVEKMYPTGETYYNYGDYAIECTYVGGAVTYDIALIRARTEEVKRINPSAKQVTLADEYFVGETAIAIGNPNGEGLSVTQGIVSVDNENISLAIDKTSRNYRSVRIDTALYGGNSGGGVFNAKGELIGIANAGSTTQENINYAVPIQIAKGVAHNILAHYLDGIDATKGVLKITFGVTVTAKNSKYVYDVESMYGRVIEDIMINEVIEGSIAQSMGLKDGDKLTAIIINNKKYPLYRNFDIGDCALLLTNGVTVCFEYVDGEEIFMTNSHLVTLSDLNSVA